MSKYDRNLMMTLMLTLFVGMQAAMSDITRTDVFVSGQDGYHTYRIPSIIIAPDQSILAFCEGRKNSSADTGEIHLLMKRSVDGGRTWSKQRVLWSDGANTCGNPCPVIDAASGKIFLFMTWNLGSDHAKEMHSGTAVDTRRVFVMTSDDNGETWPAPAEVTGSVKKDEWNWYATGPGVGIQLQNGLYKGRLIIPANHSFSSGNGGNSMGAHVVYSDDQGETWQISESVHPLRNESQAVELLDGRVMLNSRSSKKMRAISLSTDGGETWPERFFDEDLVGTPCQGSLIRYAPNKWTDQNVLIFTNPTDMNKRINLTAKVSYDDGQTWPVARVICSGRSAYSCLTTLPDGRIGCLYETGESRVYEKIVFAEFSLDWLLNK